jgi:MFS family permease
VSNQPTAPRESPGPPGRATPAAAVRKAVGFLGINRSIGGLMGMVILVGMGEKMAERFLPIYMLALGGGILSVGLLNSLDNLLSALYSFPGGYLADRYGTKRALLLFNLMAMAGYLIVILVPKWYAVILGAVLFLSWTAISLPATMQLVNNVMPRNKRTMGVSMHSLIKRVPMSLGPLVGGAFIVAWGETTGVRLAFVAALIMAIIATLAQERMITDARSTRGDRDRTAEHNPFRLWKEMSPDLRELLVSDILVRFCEQIPFAFVVIWAMKSLGTPGIGGHPVTAFQFGVLTTIEMATAVLCYIPVAYYADKTGKKPFIVATFGFFTLFPVVLWFSRSFWPLVGAFIIRGLKEFGEPTRKALIMDLSPEDRKAGMFGLYYLIRDVIVSLAAFGGALLWQRSPAINFIAAFAFGVLGTAWFGWKGKDLPVVKEPA